MATSSDGSWLTAIVDWAVSLMDVVGPAGAGLAIALENLFPPLPSEVILPMAGLTASRGTFTLIEALAWTTLGSIVGAFLLYGLGRGLGRIGCGLTAAGSLVWNTVFVLAGFFLGESWHVVETYAGILQYVVIAVVGTAVAWFVFARIRAFIRDRAEGRQNPSPAGD